jgi:hypothetical protein
LTLALVYIGVVTVLLIGTSCTSLSLLEKPNSDSYSINIGVVSPEVKRLRRETDHPLLISVEVKNEWNYTTASSRHLCGVDGDIFTFTGTINFQFVPHIASSAIKLVKPVGFVFALGGNS